MKILLIFLLFLGVGCASSPSYKKSRLEIQKEELESMGFKVEFKK